MLLATLLVLQGSWKLVWSDEFNRPGAPDPAKWGYEKGFVRNQEVQFYTEGRAENARVENGKLVIEARKDGFGGHPVSSASLTTQGKASWTYGKIEVRAKIPKGKGTWPAIWTLGTGGRWPDDGEIDILENVGYEPNTAHFTVHSTKLDGTGHEGWCEGTEVPNLSAAFHTYTLEWTPEGMDWKLDGGLVHRYSKADPHGVKWTFDKPQYLILNLAIGGAWGGQQGIDESIYPSRFEIDYVRVYAKK